MTNELFPETGLEGSLIKALVHDEDYKELAEACSVDSIEHIRWLTVVDSYSSPIAYNENKNRDWWHLTFSLPCEGVWKEEYLTTRFSGDDLIIESKVPMASFLRTFKDFLKYCKDNVVVARQHNSIELRFQAR